MYHAVINPTGIREFEGNVKTWKTRAAGECLLHFSSVLNVRRVLSQCNTRLRLLYLLNKMVKIYANEDQKSKHRHGRDFLCLNLVERV